MNSELKRVIEISINENFYKNMFSKYKEEGLLEDIFYKYILENISSTRNIIKEDFNKLVEHTVEEIIYQVVKLNQYVLVTNDITNNIKKNTKEFYERIININSEYQLKEVFISYQKSIINILRDIEELRYMMETDKIETIPCFQYTPEHQIKLLGLDIKNLKEPILDLGCGESGSLVLKLRGLGYEAYGIDRIIRETKEYLIKKSWFDVEFENEEWGTIISHLSFTNHFKRENLKVGRGHIDYAKKYMEILYSLKVGGTFYYLPNLPFIEEYLPDDQFYIEKILVDKMEKGIKSIKLTRNK